MFASIRHYQFKSGSAATVTDLVRQEFVPIISSAPGFLSYLLLDHPNDEITTVSVFNSEAEAVESNRLAADWVKRSLTQYVEGPVHIMAGEVAIVKMA